MLFFPFFCFCLLGLTILLFLNESRNNVNKTQNLKISFSFPSQNIYIISVLTSRSIWKRSFVKRLLLSSFSKFFWLFFLEIRGKSGKGLVRGIFRKVRYVLVIRLIFYLCVKITGSRYYFSPQYDNFMANYDRVVPCRPLETILAP